LKRFDAIVLALQKTDQPKVIQEWRIEDSRLRWTVHQKHSRRSLAKTVRELINRCKKRKTELAVLPSGLFALERGTVRLSGNSLLSMEKLRSRSDIKAFFDNREPIFPARTILPSPARLRGRLAKARSRLRTWHSTILRGVGASRVVSLFFGPAIPVQSQTFPVIV